MPSTPCHVHTRVNALLSSTTTGSEERNRRFFSRVVLRFRGSARSRAPYAPPDWPPTCVPQTVAPHEQMPVVFRVDLAVRPDRQRSVWRTASHLEEEFAQRHTA